MVNQYFPGDRLVYVGLSTDTKPAAAIGCKFIETDTGKVYLNTGAWVQIGVIAAGATTTVGAFV